MLLFWALSLGSLVMLLWGFQVLLWAAHTHTHSLTSHSALCVSSLETSGENSTADTGLYLDWIGPFCPCLFIIQSLSSSLFLSLGLCLSFSAPFSVSVPITVSLSLPISVSASITVSISLPISVLCS